MKNIIYSLLALQLTMMLSGALALANTNGCQANQSGLTSYTAAKGASSTSSQSNKSGQR